MTRSPSRSCPLVSRRVAEAAPARTSSPAKPLKRLKTGMGAYSKNFVQMPLRRRSCFLQRRYGFVPFRFAAALA